jgi:hypothetical protein|tara:strand:+ start:3619 stop:3774 length:156 start_codon:yes stop_codon:yes gene_type:complete
MTTYSVILERADGSTYEWQTLAASAAKATMAAAELCPECNIIRVSLKGDWG